MIDNSPTGPLAGLLQDCERTSAEGLELVGTAQGDEPLRARWRDLHARLVELEVRATAFANATRDTQLQRRFDQLAGALIALRGAVDADVRLRSGPGATLSVVTAGDEMVIVRCDDVFTAVLAIGTPPT